MNEPANTGHGKPRRILIFSLVYYPRFVGGAEIAVKEITDRIGSGQFEFDMVCLNGGGEPPVEKIGAVTLQRICKSAGPVQKLLFPFTAFFKARKLNHSRGYDAVWSIMANRAGFAALFFKLANPDIPFILTLQEGDPLDYPRRRAWFIYPIFQPLFRCIFSRADRIQAISNYLADWARKMGARCPITVIPNAVDYDHFSKPIPQEKALELKTKLNKKEGDVFIIHTGRLVKKNAVGDIVAALQYLPSNVKLLIVGRGALESNLKSQISNLKLENRVKFAGQVSHSELPAYLQVSDIFIRPSLSEGLGNSFLEAMAAGIPVIGTPVGGIPDFLHDGETGLVCEVGNPKSIAQKVEKLIRDKESREYIVNKAKKMVADKYEWNDIAKRMENILRMHYTNTQ